MELIHLFSRVFWSRLFLIFLPHCAAVCLHLLFTFNCLFTNLDERGGNGGGRRENMGTTGLSLRTFGGVEVFGT